MSSRPPIETAILARLAFLGLRQVDLAAAFGIHRSGVCRLIQAASVNPDAVQRLAVALVFNPELARTITDAHPAMERGKMTKEAFFDWWARVRSGDVRCPDPLRRSVYGAGT